jgi:MFS family permease
VGTGALSDRIGRKGLIAWGLAVQATSLAVIALGQGFAVWAVGAIGLGVGTAMAYPALLAAVGDVADVFGLVAAIWVVAGITMLGAALVAVRMYETHPRAGLSSMVPD